MTFQSVRTNLLASFATAMVFAFTVQSPVQAGTVQDGSWGGNTSYDRLVYDTYARQFGNQYDSVGIMQVKVGNYSINSASGTLIGRRWVLTAAHVVEGNEAMTFKINGQTYNANRWFVHKGYQGSNNIELGRDIALVKLDRPVMGVSTSRVAPRSAASSMTGEEVTTVGYGNSGTGLTGAGIPASIAPTLSDYSRSIAFGVKRAGRNRVDESFFGMADTNLYPNLYNRMFSYDFDPEEIWRRNPSVIGVNYLETEDELLNGSGFDDVAIAREWSPTPGDSGGPTFNEDGQIVGITSFGTIAWYQVDDFWFRAAGFYKGLNMDGERAGATVAPTDDAPDMDNYFSEIVFTNAALYSNWIKRVKRLANTPGSGQKLLTIAKIGSEDRGPVAFEELSAYKTFFGVPISTFTLDAFNNPVIIPEPGAMMLLSAGSLMILRRRRA